MNLRRMVCALSLLTVLGQEAASAAPDPSQVFIKRITYSGSGCADSTKVGATLATDAKSFTLIFDEYFAEIGPGVPPGASSKKCKVTLDLRFPSGYSYALTDYTYRGFADLEAGVTARQSSLYYFQNNPGDFAHFNSTFRGPTFEDFTFTDTIPTSEWVFSRCGRVKPLVVETKLELNNAQNPGAGGMIGIDSLDGRVRTIYRYRIYWSDSLCD